MHAQYAGGHENSLSQVEIMWQAEEVSNSRIKSHPKPGPPNLLVIPVSQKFSFELAASLAAAVAHRRPEVRRELLRVLVEEDELGDGPLAQRARRPRGPGAALLLQQLAVDERDQLALHGPRQLLPRRLPQVRRQLLGGGHRGGVLREGEVGRGRRQVGRRAEGRQVGAGVEQQHQRRVAGQLRQVQADRCLQTKDV